MESDGSKVTAKNIYGGPLLLRTVFHEEGSEETYQYLYNAHGDVVTLLANGEVAATYYYDSFGNVLEQTGNVDNSILYAGYQYDEETGLYYINARMYDPVTARFLQADTYLGTASDPLSLNLYTYCLNNPHKYTDPSGHFAITAGIVIGAIIWGLVGVGIEYKMQKDAGGIIDYNHVIFQGTLNAAIALISGGTANGMMAAQQGARMTARTFGRMMLMEAGFGVAEGIIGETGYQLINGTKIKDLDVGHIAVSGVMGGASGVGGALAGEAFGAGLKMLKNTRVVSKAINTMQDMASRGKNAIRRGVDKLADFGRHQLGVDSVAYVTPEGLVVRGPRVPDNGMRLFAESGKDGLPSGKVYRSDRYSWKIGGAEDIKYLGKGNVGDFSNLEGTTIEEVLSRIPENAVRRELIPEFGKVTEGFEYKWVQDGKTYRVRIHGVDTSAPVGSNAANGWIVRVQQGKKYLDPISLEFQPPGITNIASPNYSEELANRTHIPIINPE